MYLQWRKGNAIIKRIKVRSIRTDRDQSGEDRRNTAFFLTEDALQSRKYVDDYRLDNVLDANGRLRTVSVYAGDWYGFVLTGRARARLKTVCAVAALIAAVSAVFPLCRSVPVMRAWYVCLPAVFTLLPAGMAVGSAVYILTAGEKVTREHRDKSTDRMKGASAGLLILSALTLAGETAYLLINGADGGLVSCMLSSALTLAAAVVLFLQKKRLEMEKLPS